jgi:hypothetical protein
MVSAVIDLHLAYVLMGCSGPLDNKGIKQVAMTKRNGGLIQISQNQQISDERVGEFLM